MKLGVLRKNLEAVKKKLDEYKSPETVRETLENNFDQLLSKEYEEFLKTYTKIHDSLTEKYEEIEKKFFDLQKGKIKKAAQKDLATPGSLYTAHTADNNFEEINLKDPAEENLENFTISEEANTDDDLSEEELDNPIIVNSGDELDVDNAVAKQFEDALKEFENSLKKIDHLHSSLFITCTDARKKLKNVQICEIIAQQAPKDLKEKLNEEFKGKAPEELKTLCEKYKKAYDALQEEHNNIEDFISTEGENPDTLILLEEMVKRTDALRSHKYELIALYSNIQIERKKAFREKNNDQLTFSSNKNEKIIFTTKDFSDSFLQKYTQPLENLAKIFSGAFNLASVNEKVTATGSDSLAKNGISLEFKKDYGRSLYSINGKTAGYEYTPGNTTGESDLEGFVNLYLKTKGLNEITKNNTTPNLLGLLSLLGGQGTLLGLSFNNLAAIFSLNLYKDDLDTPTDCAAYWRKLLLRQTHLSIKDGKLHIESFYVSKTPTKDLMAKNEEYPDEDYPGDLSEDLLTHKISFDIDLNIDNNHQPIFTINDFAIDLTINKPTALLDQKQLLINGTHLKNPEAINSQYIDLLRPELDNIVKFCGHRSLEEFLYLSDTNQVKNEVTRRRNAKENSHTQLFATYFIKNLTKNPTEIAFLESLRKACYKNHANKETLSNHIFSFVIQQFPTLSFADKKRYLHLLKVAENLGASPQKIVDFLSQQENGPLLLLEATKVSKNIYQELIRPQENFASFIRSIREWLPNWFFGVTPRPAFDESVILKKVLSHPDNLTTFKTLFTNDSVFSDNFFNDLEKEINQLPMTDKKNYLNQLLEKGDIEVIQTVRNKIPNLFIQHATHCFDDSIESVNERLELILLSSIKNPTEVKNRFGKHFIDQLWEDLYNLRYEETENSSATLTQISRLAHIQKVLEVNPWLKEEPLYLKLHTTEEKTLAASAEALKAEANVQKAMDNLDEDFENLDKLVATHTETATYQATVKPSTPSN